MGKSEKNTPTQLIVFCIFYVIMITLNSLLVINSPFIFIRVINLIVIIILSAAVGAFIREIFVLKGKEKSLRVGDAYADHNDKI